MPTYLARLELHGRAIAECCKQSTVCGILHWFLTVARAIADQVLEVIIALLLVVLGDIPCNKINMG